MTAFSTRVFRFSDVEVHEREHRVTRAGRQLAIEPKALRVLVYLLRNAGHLVTKEELLTSVWGDTAVTDNSLTRAIAFLRRVLEDDPRMPCFIETVSTAGYRFVCPVETVEESSGSPVAQVNPQVPAQIFPEQAISASGTKVQVGVKDGYRWRWLAVAAVVLVAVSTAAFRFFVHGATRLNEKDTIVLADFSNSTGDPVFDGTLRQGLAVELEQSPFFSLVSDQRIQQTLRLMGQPSDARLTSPIAQDLCQRTQSAAYLAGSIASLGNQYVIGLKAVSCPKGDVLGEEQETASGKESILGALDRAAGRLRKKLGESLSRVEKFDTPLEQATTPSLEALQAYTFGRKTQGGKDDFFAAVPFYKRAVQLDPNFALAHSALGSVYTNLGETLLGAESAKRAYELHAPISGPEKFYVESTYFHYVTGDLEKARQVYDLWIQTYPRDSAARIRLGQLYAQEGKYEDAISQTREAIRLDPWKGLSYSMLVGYILSLNRFEEADATAQQALANGHDSPGLRASLYRLAFLRNDLQEMARQVKSVGGDSHYQGEILEQEASTAAYSGHLNQSRDLSRRAIESAMRAQEKETAANFQANAALREALSGNMAQARSLAAAALAIPTGRRGVFALALSLAIAGDVTRAQTLADDLAKRYPNDTLVNYNLLPTIRAQIALDHHDPSRAIDLLQSAGQYELSAGISSGLLGPVYVRGEAYLVKSQGTEAIDEFRKILDHTGIVANDLSGALARLQLGRAYAITGDKAKARSAYEDFLNLWKDADPDIAVLKQAKAEYAVIR